MSAKFDERAALVLYGSETGNAQEIAEEIGRICERLYFDVKLSDLNSIGIVSRNIKGEMSHILVAANTITSSGNCCNIPLF